MQTIVKDMELKMLNEQGIELVVNRLFVKYGDGIQFDIMDLNKICDAPRKILEADGNIADAIEAIELAIEQYRIN